VTRWIKDDPELRAIPVVAVDGHFAIEGRRGNVSARGGCEAYLSKADLGRQIYRKRFRRFIIG